MFDITKSLLFTTEFVTIEFVTIEFVLAEFVTIEFDITKIVISMIQFQRCFSLNFYEIVLSNVA